ncbi:MAG: hypothetical protein Q8N63_01000 [Nanoarchaeota archaeon]|nr:hypothetical protein [Nanoarchaeota archaeon]
MNLVDYIVKNRGLQRGDEHHDSFIQFLSGEKILKFLGINPPYLTIGFEVKVSNSDEDSRKCDLAVFNHELTIIEAKVIRSQNCKTKKTRIEENNRQLCHDYSFFNKRKIDAGIRLIGAYKFINEEEINFYNLPPCGLSLDDLEILQVPCL